MTKKSKEELREEFLKEFSYKSRLAHSSSVSMYYSAKSPEEAATWWIAKVEAAEAAAEERKVVEVRAGIEDMVQNNWSKNTTFNPNSLRYFYNEEGGNQIIRKILRTEALTLPTKSEDHE